MKKSAYRHPSATFLQELRLRHKNLYQALGHKMCLVQAASGHNSTTYSRLPFKQDSDFFYLTGCHAEQAVALFAPKSNEPYKLFLPPEDKYIELWNGPMTPIENGTEAFGADGCYPLSELKNHLKVNAATTDTLYLNLRQKLAANAEVTEALEHARVHGSGIELRHLRRLLGQLRLKKSHYEIENLRMAGKIGSEMHKVAMKTGNVGVNECEIQAALEHYARTQGSHWMGYPSIVASGSNSCCLHYVVNNCDVAQDELVLVDAGCEWESVTSDITRTWPASSKFTKLQRDLYSLVLSAQSNALAIIKPGATLKMLEDVATETLVDGMLRLGLLKGTAKEIIEKKEYKHLYPHSIGHWLGGDVHDVGHYLEFGSEIPLQEGHCFTVEPGIYVPLDHQLASHYNGIGIRIEDNIVVTAQGHENLTICPKGVDEIEHFIGQNRAIS